MVRSTSLKVIHSFIYLTIFIEHCVCSGLILGGLTAVNKREILALVRLTF